MILSSVFLTFCDQISHTLGTERPAIGAHWCSLIECSNLIGRVPTTRTAPLSFAANISRGPEFRVDPLGQRVSQYSALLRNFQQIQGSAGRKGSGESWKWKSLLGNGGLS